jgi:hypothetical protein
MARTRIPSHLIHRPEVVARDQALLEGLSRIVLPIVRRESAVALARCTADTAARAIAEDSRQALREILREESLAVEDRGLVERLAHALAASPSASPSVEQVEEHAQRTALVMTRQWVSMLFQALKSDPTLDLDENLLPLGERHRELLRKLMTTLRPFALNRDEAATIMRMLRNELLRSRDVAELPHGIRLEVRGRGQDGEPKRILALRESG